MTIATRIRRLLTGFLALGALVTACDATPLPYPPDMRTDRFSLTADGDGRVTLTGAAGAVGLAGATLRLRNATRPAAPVDLAVAADGSFSAAIDGYLIDTLRIDRTGTDAGILLHIASAGAPAVRRVPAPPDADGDGWAAGLDCDDTDPHVFPGAPERCNGRDDDCDGVFDEGAACACAADADCGMGGACDGGTLCLAGSCAAGAPVDCDDGDPATVDICDPSSGGCTHGPAAAALCGNGVLDAGEACDDGNTAGGDGCTADCRACVATAEVCNGLDDDCDGVVDDGLSCPRACTTDADCDDGLFCTLESCVAGACAALPGLPCDDGDPTTVDVCDETTGCSNMPCGSVVEVCNGIDDDCNGLVDDGGVCDCPAGQTDCGGSCADLQSDDANCGACGTACPAGQTCAAGVCTA